MERKRVAVAILDFLDSCPDSEEFLVAKDCLMMAFGVGEEERSALSIHPITLEQLIAKAEAECHSGAGGSGEGPDSSSSSLSQKPQVEEFLQNLRAANFFAGVQEGSPEYSLRLQQAMAAFESCTREQQQQKQEEEAKKGEDGSSQSQKQIDQGGEHSVDMASEQKDNDEDDADRDMKADAAAEEALMKEEVTSAAVPALSRSTTDNRENAPNEAEEHKLRSSFLQANGEQPRSEEETRAAAEKLKAEGNAAMSAKTYEEAVSLYTQAISLCESNAIYYANRAAAHHQLGNFMAAVADCERAITIQPTYAKAFSRLGTAYMSLGRFQEAIDLGFSKAVQLDPSSQTYRENLQSAQSKLAAAKKSEEQQQQQHGGEPSASHRSHGHHQQQQTHQWQHRHHHNHHHHHHQQQQHDNHHQQYSYQQQQQVPAGLEQWASQTLQGMLPEGLASVNAFLSGFAPPSTAGPPPPGSHAGTPESGRSNEGNTWVPRSPAGEQAAAAAGGGGAGAGPQPTFPMPPPPPPPQGFSFTHNPQQQQPMAFPFPFIPIPGVNGLPSFAAPPNPPPPSASTGGGGGGSSNSSFLFNGGGPGPIPAATNSASFNVNPENLPAVVHAFQQMLGQMGGSQQGGGQPWPSAPASQQQQQQHR